MRVVIEIDINSGRGTSGHPAVLWIAHKLLDLGWSLISNTQIRSAAPWRILDDAENVVGHMEVR